MTQVHRELLRLFRSVVRQGDAFAPEIGERVRDSALARRLGATLAATPPADLVLAVLRAMALQGDSLERGAIDVKFVATLPGFDSSVARPTEEAIDELMAAAKHQIIAVGYEITETRFVDSLHLFGSNGGQVVLVTDRKSGHGRRLLSAWPAQIPLPKVYHERRTGVSRMSKMHGKALLVDGEQLFVSSANFTWLGMNANIELGVILSGPGVRPARDLFDELILHSGLLERVLP